MPVREIISFTKKLILELEEVSPWKRPIDATGPKRDLGNLKISNDLSDFEDVVLKTMTADKMKYIKDPDDGDYSVALDSTSYGACAINLSDFPQRKSVNESVMIRMNANSKKLKKTIHGFGLSVPQFRPDEINQEWSDQKVVREVVRFLIEFLDPVYLSVIESTRTFSVLERGVDKYKLGWISYTSNKNFVDALSGFPDTRSFHNGILIDLGESVSTLNNPEADKKVLKIRDHLREFGATDWLAIVDEQ